MSTHTHTLGPWHVWKARTVLHVSNGTKDIVSLSISPPRVPEKDIREKSVAETEANATLIASAPDLLEALEAIIAAADSESAQGGEMWYAEAVGPAIEAARAALAKANPLVNE